MSEFWKSIPKIYCKFCNVWYQDNKSSRDFHERSFKHKNNISRHIVEVRKQSNQKEKEEAEFKLEMQKIERAAMSAYEKDLANKPVLATASSSSNQEKDEMKKRLDLIYQQEASEKLRQEALDIVSNKLKKKHEWFESKTIEGKKYYYNRTTMETRWTEPKSGYVTIEEQKEMNLTDVPGDQSEAKAEGKQFKHEQFAGGWQEVTNNLEIDLQLPKIKAKPKLESKVDLTEREELKFKEKILDGEVFKSKKKEQSFGFKKRKLNNSDSRRMKSDE